MSGIYSPVDLYSFLRYNSWAGYRLALQKRFQTWKWTKKTISYRSVQTRGRIWIDPSSKLSFSLFGVPRYFAKYVLWNYYETNFLQLFVSKHRYCLVVYHTTRILIYILWNRNKINTDLEWSQILCITERGWPSFDVMKICYFSW